jgi:transposase
MIRPGFLDPESRQDLIELTRDGSAAHRLSRRANALVLLDDGMSCEAIAKVLFVDDDTIRDWYQRYQEDGVEGLTIFEHEGGVCRLPAAERERLKAWIGETLPCSTREIGAWIARECGIEYQGRSGLVALLHRLGIEYRKPTAISRKLDPVKQAAFIKKYEDLLNQLPADEVVMFGDAVHPTHAVRPVGCWAPKEVRVAVEQSSGRDPSGHARGQALERSRRDRPRDRQDRHAGRADGGRREHDHAADGDRGDVPGQAAGPPLRGQCQIPSRETGAGMAGEAGVPDQASLHPGLLPASQPNRTAMGLDAQAHYSQQVLRQLQGFQHRNADLPARRRAEELGHLLRQSHGQLPNHQPKGFSGSRVSEV